MSEPLASENDPSAPQTGAAAHWWFPGWTMVGIAALAQYMSAPGQSYSVAALKDPMRSTLEISETDYSLAYAAATLVSAAMVPLFGRSLDRFGARMMLPLIATGLGLACFLMSHTRTLSDLYVAFAFVRTLGQGALFLVSVWMVGEWFERRRGIATAICGLGGGLSVMTIPLINDVVVQTWNWQTAWVVLAAAVSCSLVLPSILLVRDRPEDLGLYPDGGVAVDLQITTGGPVVIPLEDSWTVREAVTDATFWKLLSVPATSGLIGTGLIFHQVALFAQHGLSSREALTLMTVQAVCATLMSFPADYATDRIPSRYLLFCAMVMLAASTLLATALPLKWMALIYALLMGLHGSILRSTATVVWINYYGRAHQGEVRGFAWAVMIVGAAIGPLPLAWSIDQTGSYTPALAAFLVLPLLAGVAVWTAIPPRREPPPVYETPG